MIINANFVYYETKITMKAKDKAKELVDKFKEITPCFDYEFEEKEMYEEQLLFAKESALMCVDEIIDSHYKVFTGTKASVNDYWQDVKQEINKL